MELHIVKWGNGAAVRIPGFLLAEVGAKAGDVFEARLFGDILALRVTPPEGRATAGEPPASDWPEDLKPPGWSTPG